LKSKNVKPVPGGVMSEADLKADLHAFESFNPKEYKGLA